MFVRTAGERDLAAVRALLVETWHATYDAIYGAAEVTEITDEWHSIASLKARLTRPNSEFLVADDGKRIGGMAFAAATADAKIILLNQLYVLPDCQRQGHRACAAGRDRGQFPGSPNACVSRWRKPTARPSPSTDRTGSCLPGNAATIPSDTAKADDAEFRESRSDSPPPGCRPAIVSRF